MRNPLIRRIPREVKDDLGKYLAIFLFMVMFIGLVSGFLVTDGSCMYMYDKSFTENKIESGHFAINRELPEQIKKQLEEKAEISVYPYFYFEENITDTDKNVRVYSLSRDINLLFLMSGEYPDSDSEIALDRMFATANKINIGDTIFLAGKQLTVSGLITSPDYSSLFENSSDMMFDTANFCVAVMTDNGFNAFGGNRLTYNYVWCYNEYVERTDKITAKEKSDRLIDALEDVIADYDTAIADKAAEYGKLVSLDKILKAMDNSLQLYGGITVYDNEKGYSELADKINSRIKNNNESVNETLFSAEDVKSAMKAEKTDIEKAQAYIDNAENEIIEIKDFLPAYLNQAINFVGDDMGGDKIMFIAFDYILTVVLAFVFAITTSNTIAQESGVIGTLRASGYTRGEILRHYLILPLSVTLIAAIIGNVLGYTVLIEPVRSVYYGSYSLPPYKSLFSAEAFMLTTVIPVAIMLIINVAVIWNKLKLTPLQFLRKELSHGRKKKVLKLSPGIAFMSRFRMRIIFQNIPNYLTLFFGIFVGGVPVIFGLMFGPLLSDYKEMIVADRICDYQYVLTEQTKTTDTDAEKYALTSLRTTDKRFMEDEISVYGILPDSKYVKADTKSGKITISCGIAEKFGLKQGDTITLKDPFNEKKLYKFTIDNIAEYNSGMAIFMPIADYCGKFGESKDYFTGYFSNCELTDIDSNKVATVITVSDMTKAADQLTASMGEIMGMFCAIGVVIFCLLMYILSKQIIEKNANAISMSKILGFKNSEIAGLYIIATSIVVLLSLLLTIPLLNFSLKAIFDNILYTRMTGYIPFSVSPDCYIKMFALGALSYAAVAVIQIIKINRIPKADALKNRE